MEDTIINTYYLCDELLKTTRHRDDPQVRLSTAEVMTTALVAAAVFSGNIETTRSFLDEYGYIEKAISKSRSNRRLHDMDSSLWQQLFDLLAESFKHNNLDKSSTVRAYLDYGGRVKSQCHRLDHCFPEPLHYSNLVSFGCLTSGDCMDSLRENTASYIPDLSVRALATPGKNSADMRGTIEYMRYYRKP